jgi:hypothetical protein
LEASFKGGQGSTSGCHAIEEEDKLGCAIKNPQEIKHERERYVR